MATLGLTDRRQAARLTLVGVAVGYAVASSGVAPPYPFANLLSPFVWEVVFIVAAFLTGAVAVYPRSQFARTASMLAVNLASGSRAMALLILAGPGARTPAAAWLIVTALQVYAWPHLTGHRHG